MKVGGVLRASFKRTRWDRIGHEDRHRLLTVLVIVGNLLTLCEQKPKSDNGREFLIKERNTWTSMNSKRVAHQWFIWITVYQTRCSLYQESQTAKHIDALRVWRDEKEIRNYSFHGRDHNIHIKSVMNVIGKVKAQYIQKCCDSTFPLAACQSNMLMLNRVL